MLLGNLITDTTNTKRSVERKSMLPPSEIKSKVHDLDAAVFRVAEAAAVEEVEATPRVSPAERERHLAQCVRGRLDIDNNLP